MNVVIEHAETAQGRSLLPSLFAGPLAAIVILGIALARGPAVLGLEALCIPIGAALATLLVIGVERVIDIDDAPWWLTLARSSAAYAVVRIPASLFFPPGTSGIGWSSGIPFVVTEVVAAFTAYWLFDTNEPQDAVFTSIPITLLAIGLPHAAHAVL